MIKLLLFAAIAFLVFSGTYGEKKENTEAQTIQERAAQPRLQHLDVAEAAQDAQEGKSRKESIAR